MRWSSLSFGKGLLAAIVILFAIGTSSLAMTVSPMQIEMTSTGRTSRGVISVVNDSNSPLPVELVAKRIALNESGAPTTSPAEDDFLVMPPQALIAPGSTQNFRIQWLGDPLLGESESYFIYVNQIPVKLSRARQLQLVFSMAVMVNVAPPHGVPELILLSSEVVSDVRGRRHPMITVENPTSVHALFPQSSVRVTNGDWSETITGAVLAQSIGIGLVQPGHRRRFILPLDLPPAISSVQCRLEFNPKR